MKKYRNFIYTAPFKGLLALLIVALSWVTSGSFLKLYTYSIENNVGVRNVFRQGFSFNYESSAYADAEVENTVDCVLEYSLKYMHSKNFENAASKKEYDEFLRRDNDSYRELADFLSGLSDVSFAVVNHATGKIVSNITKIDNADSGTEIRHLFSDKGEYMIIMYNCRNPYFETGFTERFVESIREKAENYSDNFDLYISFGDSLYITDNDCDYKQLHRQTINQLQNGLLIFFILLAFTLISAATFFSISGKAEKNGKIIPTATDSYPNDIILILYILIGISVNVLYHNSLYMLYKSFTIDNYGLGLSPEYYAQRANMCIAAFALTACMSGCKIKRQKKLGTLTKNTCIYRFYSGIKQKNIPEK